MTAAINTSFKKDFQAMREKMPPLTDARDKKLKEILGDANYKIWKDAIEPTMVRRPRNN